MRLSDAVVDHHSPDEKHESSLYWHHVYRVVTPMLDDVAQRIQQELQGEGYKTFPIPASMPYNREILKGLFPHKLAAHLSGLGWIGKSCLLITPDFGPRVRLVTVFTDAPLSTGTPPGKKCGKCKSCVEACPVQAFKGVEFRPEDPVEARFDTRACEQYRRTHPCGLCVAACPFGQRQ
jgi:epoxyqueuosine reductase QueG